MEEREIYNLIERFEGSTLTGLKLQRGDFSLELEKGAQPVKLSETVDKAGANTAASAVSQPEAAAGTKAESEPASNYRQVKSPIVGIYYAAAGPQQEPFVKIGQKVEKGQVLCLVEAMKMMNELKSPIDGIIRTVSGINGKLVEFDQVLFEVEPC